jgi:hypothetical protein
VNGKAAEAKAAEAKAAEAKAAEAKAAEAKAAEAKAAEAKAAEAKAAEAKAAEAKAAEAKAAEAKAAEAKAAEAKAAEAKAAEAKAAEAAKTAEAAKAAASVTKPGDAKPNAPATGQPGNGAKPAGASPAAEVKANPAAKATPVSTPAAKATPVSTPAAKTAPASTPAARTAPASTPAHQRPRTKSTPGVAAVRERTLTPVATPAQTRATPAAAPVDAPARTSAAASAAAAVAAVADSVDDLIDGILADNKPGGSAGAGVVDGVSSDADRAEVQATFAQLAGQHLFQLQGLLGEVQLGPTTTAWVGPAQSEVRSLRKMAGAVEAPELGQALTAIDEALESIRRTGDAVIEGLASARLLEAGAGLRRALPTVFAGEQDNHRRHAIIVQALLQQVPDVDDYAIDRIFASGLNRLERLMLGRADEIAAATGLPHKLAADVVAHIDTYRRESGGLLAAPDRDAELGRLGAAIDELTDVHQAFERACNGWSDEDRKTKRKMRRRRESVYARVRLTLARLGEMDGLGRVERLPYQRKLEELVSFVQQARLAKPPSGVSARA